MKEVQPIIETPQYECGRTQLEYEIFKQESSCNPASVNSIGCIGLGQACRTVKDTLIQQCPNWQTDIQCQYAFWEQYAMSYGSWEQAHEYKFCMGDCYSSRIKQMTFKEELYW